MKSYFTIALLLFLFIGCGGVTPKISPSELPNYKEEIGYIKDYKFHQNWIQPSNKTVECKMSIEDFRPVNTPENNVETTYTWDGECKNGKAQGLGKLTHSTMYGDVFEIGYVKDGKSTGLFYHFNQDSNIAKYGIYKLEENDKKISGKWFEQAKLENGKYSPWVQGFQNDKIQIFQGTIKQKFNDGGEAVISGEFGIKKALVENIISKHGSTIISYWGYFDMSNQRFDGYGILRNNRGLYHTYHEKGVFKYFVQLPQSFIDTVNNVVADAKAEANKAYRYGQQALIMKKRYDKLHPQNIHTPAPKKPKASHGISTGTGFFVSKNGYLLTNNHVIRGSYNVYVLLNGKKVKAQIIARDPANDIALLKINKQVKPLPIETKQKMKQGEDIAVIGFPNIGLQGNEIKTTFGYINAKSGIQGDGRFCQISAPIQPGNSGSPLLHKNGKVVGIVSSTLNQGAMINATGTLAQNVNYAVKIAYAMPLLMSNDVPYITKVSKTPKSKVELVEMAQPSVVLIIAE